MKGGDDNTVFAGCVPACLCQSASTGASGRGESQTVFFACFIFFYSILKGNSLETHLLNLPYCPSTHSLRRYFANLAVSWGYVVQ